MKASVLALAFLCLAGCASAASDPTCANGLKASHAGETICCAASCGVCGGPRCATSPGGAAKCCPSAIKAAATSCKAAEAPCIVDGVTKQAVTLTTEQLQKYVLEMNKLDINGVITGQQANYTFRQGRHCSVVAAGMRLDEEIDLSQEPTRSWTTLSMDEVKQYGLPTGHWQKLL